MRVEHDFLGEMALDDALYYGIQTARGMQASQVTGDTYGEKNRRLIDALATIKKAAAQANQCVGGLDAVRAEAIVTACDEVLAGRFYDQFPVDVITGGGGVSLHMNMNEVLAHRASELAAGIDVHPNTHVNMGQSTNDVVPSAMLLATYADLQDVQQAVAVLADAVQVKAEEWKDVVKLGRTCLQDAVPVTLGQELSGWHSCLLRQKEALAQCAVACLYLPLGGTAIGTGAGVLPGYTDAVFALLSEMYGVSIQPVDNRFDGLQFADGYVRISAALKALAGGVSKMAADLRLLSSGPRGGLGEIVLPAVLPGSSIMPGKINPILSELMMQVYFLVCGNDLAVTLATERGELDLNVWEAVISKCISESCHLLARGLPLFASACIRGMQANADHCRAQAENSAAVASVVSSVFGYETGSEIAREALESGKKIKDIVVERGLLTQDRAERLLDPILMTDGVKMAEIIAEERRLIEEKRQK